MRSYIQELRTSDAEPAPIIFAAIRFGMGGALTLAGAATVLYHLANPHLFSLHSEEADVVQIALFTAVCLVSAKLTNDAKRLHHLATTDDLTGLHNLRSFEAQFKTMTRAARETKRPLAVLVLDVDELKSLNDVQAWALPASTAPTRPRRIQSMTTNAAKSCSAQQTAPCIPPKLPAGIG